MELYPTQGEETIRHMGMVCGESHGLRDFSHPARETQSMKGPVTYGTPWKYGHWWLTSRRVRPAPLEESRQEAQLIFLSTTHTSYRKVP